MLTRAKVLAATSHALKTGKLGPIETKDYLVHDCGVCFSVRVVTSLERKKAAVQGVSKNTNPFAEPDSDLVVPEITFPNHIALLNKFPVIDGHVLLVTKTFRSQNEQLMIDDMEAIELCLKDLPEKEKSSWLFFYNCGPLSGRSQPHKHVQIIPYPIESEVTKLSREIIESLPVEAAAFDFPKDFCFDAANLFSVYQKLLKTLEQTYGKERNSTYLDSHNWLLTSDCMVVVPRKEESCGDVTFNSLGFAFALLTSNVEGLEFVRKTGPMNILKHVANAKL